MLNENIQRICGYLSSMGLDDVSETLIAELSNQKVENMVAVIALALKSAATDRSEALAARLVKRSKLGKPCYLSDLLRYAERMLDMDLIDELGELHFVDEHRNVAIWGAPGTGKTCFAKAIATNACKSGISTRWITFPNLSRELKMLKEKDPRSLDTRFEYMPSSLCSTLMTITSSRSSSIYGPTGMLPPWFAPKATWKPGNSCSQSGVSGNP